MEVSKIKKEVEESGDLKVKAENSSSVVYNIEVASKVNSGDKKPKKEVSPQSPPTSVAKKGIQSAIDITVKPDKDPLSSVVYEVEVTSEVDIKPKEDDPQQVPHTSFTKEKIPSVIFFVKPDENPTSDELQLGTEPENLSNEESEINSKSSSDEEHPQPIPQSSQASSNKSNRNITKRRKKSMTIINRRQFLQCTLCSRSFPKVELLIKHARNEHGTIQNPSSNPSSEDEDENESSSQCPLCLKCLASERNLQRHFLASHIKNKSFQCPICLESKNEIKNFTTERKLKQHIAYMHDSRRRRFKFQCDVCSKKFTKRSLYENHKQIHIENKYECEYCSKIYRNKERMLRHIIAVHKEYTDRHETFKCESCGELFCSKRDLRWHVLQTHATDFFQCKICFQKFGEEGKLSRHLSFSHKQNRTWLVCDVCSKVFKNNKELVEHLEVEHKRFFKCRKCFRSFVSKEDYDSHSTAVIGEEGEPVQRHQLQCKVCHIFLNTECTFTTHKDTHLKTGEVVRKNVLPLRQADIQGCPRKCDFCPKTFLQKSLLLKHASECHPNEKWECKTCEKSFQLKYQLVKHELLHSAKKPYECKKCDKSFTDAGGLYQHERIHKKKFNCAQCNKSFALSASMRLHMANYHGAEKPFKCDTCQMDFVLKRALINHLKSNPVEGPFGCRRCSHRYKSIKLMKRHQQTCDLRSARKDGVGPPFNGDLEDMVFVCVLEGCNFQTKDEKEVAIHNALHGLPLLILSKKISRPSIKSLDSSALTSTFVQKNKERAIQPRYKCRYCLKMYNLSFTLAKHMKKNHKNVYHRRERAKFVENVFYVCYGKHCDFETKDEKKVAIHYAKHDLPKVILPRLVYGSSSQVFLSKSTPGNKRMIEAQYKCTQCFKALNSRVGLRNHTRRNHSENKTKQKKRVEIVSSSGDDEL